MIDSPHTDPPPIDPTGVLRPPIRVSGLVKSFKRRRVLDGLDLEIPAGSVVGLLGKNGAGKTTLIKCLLGLLRVDAGTVTLLDEDAWSLDAPAKACLGYVPQGITLYPWMRVGELMDYTAPFYPRWNAALVDDLLDRFEVDVAARIKTLSVGTLQKLAIILALGHEPQLLVLDEPAASLDPAARREFLKTILDIVADQRRTVLFSTHITSDLERVADRVAILRAGRIVYHGPLDELKDSVKRLHVRAPMPLPQTLDIDGSLGMRMEGSDAVVTIRGDWPGAVRRIEQTYAATIRIEDLNLEDIFLEMDHEPQSSASTGEFFLVRFHQVALTYARQWVFRAQAVGLLVTILAVCWFAPRSPLLQILLGDTVVIQVAVMSLSVACNLKEQMDDWRSRLTPRFGPAHLGIATMILAAVTVGVPMLLHGPLAVPVSGLLPATLATSALLAWAVYDPVILMVGTTACAFAAVNLGPGYIMDLLAGQHLAVSRGISLASTAVLGLLWICLSRLNGLGILPDRKMDIYFRRPVSSGSAGQTMGPLTNLLSWFLQRHHNEPARPHRGKRAEVVPLETGPALIRHRSLATGQGVNYGLAGALGILVFLAILLVAKFFSRGSPHYGGATEPEPALIVMAFGPALQTAFLLGLIWPNRWLHLAMESLLPASRRAFVRQTGAALGLNMLKFWSSGILMALAAAALVAPREVQSAAANVLAIVAISAASQIYIFGILLWALRLRHGIFASIALLLALAGPTMAAGLQLPGKTPLSFVNVILWILSLLAIGGLLTLDAYRRWCQTELD